MPNPTVWASLAVTNTVQFGIPYIDPNSIEPILDQANFSYKPNVAVMGGGGLMISNAGDFSGTDSVNSGGQVDSYIPTTIQDPLTNGKVPGHSVSTSRGTRLLPAVVQTGDFAGEHAGYAYMGAAGAERYKKVTGLDHYVNGASATDPGGELRIGVKSNIGVYTQLLRLLTASLAPMTQGLLRLGGADKGFGALTLDYTNSAVVGAVTINKPCGSGNIALGAASVVVTNNLVTANSLVLAWLMQADATLTFIKSIIPAAGTFTVTGNANATANCKFGFLVINTDS